MISDDLDKSIDRTPLLCKNTTQHELPSNDNVSEGSLLVNNSKKNKGKSIFSEKSISRAKVQYGSTTFVCTTCGKRLKSDWGLERHITAQHGERPSSTTHEEYLKKSKKSHMLSNRIKKHRNMMSYLCEVCEKTYRTAEGLEKHLRTHRGEKSYVCDYQGCEFKFLFKKNLKIHKEKHIPECPKTNYPIQYDFEVFSGPELGLFFDDPI
ncbi:PR domain zinc finger protein 5 [Thelohanellus kitauei]|uniref:PR domain zinc finger protein 5 n=1 Tax=Thelohanellus kitauei TaxID=669202 RepID=A0A0C2MYB0_THEKT|nr:PR domain zinc finger protein 5 [Thelohanellus kitauei]